MLNTLTKIRLTKFYLLSYYNKIYIISYNIYSEFSILQGYFSLWKTLRRYFSYYNNIFHLLLPHLNWTDPFFTAIPIRINNLPDAFYPIWKNKLILKYNKCCLYQLPNILEIDYGLVRDYPPYFWANFPQSFYSLRRSIFMKFPQLKISDK